MAPKKSATTTATSNSTSRSRKANTASKPSPKAATKANSMPATKVTKSKVATPPKTNKKTSATKSNTVTEESSNKANQGKKILKPSAALPAGKPAISKRKSNDEEDAILPPTKKARPTTKPSVQKTAVVLKPRKALPIINSPPTEKLDVFVFGEGDGGELGLGTAKNARGVKRPRLNPLLSVADVGVVQLAAGGMHAAALSHDNKIYTWGVNDQGALGRDTAWAGGMRSIDESEDSDDDDEREDNGLNPYECTPTAIPTSAFPEGTRFTQLAAGDSVTLALTTEGLVYGWGTFRKNEGILGFSHNGEEVAFRPTLIPELKNIKSIKCGSNHAIALDKNGIMYAWGAGQQNQLGRRIIERRQTEGLIPHRIGLGRTKIEFIACGSYHSFAIDSQKNVWAWGLNNYGQGGIAENAGDDDAVISKPTKIDVLSAERLSMITGGEHHSVGVNEAGECLVWGRADGSQIGVKVSEISDDKKVKDERGNDRILSIPAKIPGIKCSYVDAGSDQTIAITVEGKAYSWGFSACYQTGQGTDEDIDVATLIDNTAVRNKALTWVGCGGQYSIVAAPEVRN